MNDLSSTPPPQILPRRGRLPTGCPDRCDCVALVLQGRGALGAYQTGERPEWLAIPSREVGVLVHDVHRERE